MVANKTCNHVTRLAHFFDSKMKQVHEIMSICPSSKVFAISACFSLCLLNYIYFLILLRNSGPGSSVGIATDYGLEGPG